MALLLALCGLALLIAGAESLVRGAARLATAVGVSPLLVGLTVVAWGTSAPELAVSLAAAVQGQPDIAVGNVVGSNVFNVLFILGAAAAVAPLAVSQQLVRIEVPILVLASVFSWYLAADGQITRGEGFALLATGLAYTGFALRTGAAAENQVPTDAVDGAAMRTLGHVALVVVGLAALVLGSRWFVAGAVHIARWFGVSELVIGLTIVAGGTSLPELATSIVAAVRGERDISVGNVVGSNLFNLLFVLGGAAAVSGYVPVAQGALSFDFPVMVAVAVACLPVFFTGHRIARWEGWLFFGYGIAYWTYLFLASAHHDALPAFHVVMLAFVIPLTLVTVAVSVARQIRRDLRCANV